MLYKVVATVEAYFWQEEKPDKHEISDAIENEACCHELESYSITEINSINEVSEKWQKSYPYGEGGDENTVAEWLEEN